MMLMNRGKANECWFSVEYASGETFSLPLYLNALLRGQDMRKWLKEPDAFQDWMRKTVSQALGNLQYVIKPKE